MQNKYLLQINRIKLQDYVQYGIIAPDKYLGDELQKDIQSKNRNLLVLSSGYFEKIDESQIFLELILTQDEINKLCIIGDCNFLHIPLPITRIRKIYAQDQEVIKHILINLLNSEKGYLQKERFDVFEKNKEIVLEQKEYSSYDKEGTAEDFSDKLVAFDKRMGMFAFMKNASIYYSDDRGLISNYSEHYFEALSFLLDLNSKRFKELDILNQNNDFKKLLFSKNQMDAKFLEDVAQSITDLKIKETFLQLLQPNSIRKTLPLLLQLGESGLVYYLIALVYYFRQKDSNKKDNFKIDIKSLIPYEIAEVSLAILGLYLGYSNIRSEELFELKNKNFKKIFGNKFHMKFKLDSKLDYITIETLYMYSFYKKRGYEFEYLDYPNTPKAIKIRKNKSIEIVKDIKFGREVIKIKHNKGLFDV